MKKNGLLGLIALWIVIIAAIDWGLVGLFRFEILSRLSLGADVTRVIYIVVGAAGVYLLVDLILSKRR